MIPLAFLLMWVWLGTRSVILATVMHWSMNIGSTLVFPNQDPGELFAFGAVGMALVAGLVVAAS